MTMGNTLEGAVATGSLGMRLMLRYGSAWMM